jgi:Taurine catabolism dioxygenase TauD, TfdA family
VSQIEKMKFFEHTVSACFNPFLPASANIFSLVNQLVYENHDLQVRNRWGQDDVAIWDDRVVVHAATKYSLPASCPVKTVANVIKVTILVRGQRTESLLWARDRSLIRVLFLDVRHWVKYKLAGFSRI